MSAFRRHHLERLHPPVVGAMRLHTTAFFFRAVSTNKQEDDCEHTFKNQMVSSGRMKLGSTSLVLLLPLADGYLTEKRGARARSGAVMPPFSQDPGIACLHGNRRGGGFKSLRSKTPV